eukprot:jgi/Psemu1/16594/gm1.16594_g
MAPNDEQPESCGESTRAGMDFRDECSQQDSSLETKKVDSEPTVYLTLGDGDFTYSLDLARYMASSTNSHPVKLILTGIDTLETLTSKYKDSPSILEEIRTQQEQVPGLSLSIRHGVNAIVMDPKQNDDDGTGTRGKDAADHVLFHHPHLGTENCSMHKRFLAHMFYSATNYWMKENGGIFHLTLVEGQYGRWQCLEQAERHGLKLLHQTHFAPPPVTNDDAVAKTGKNNKGASNGNRYHYRRHQTGKSFATRRPNSRSITYSFGRVVDKDTRAATNLPWQSPESSSPDTIAQETVKQEPTPMMKVSTRHMLSCPFCEKQFLENRSLKCHIRDKHRCVETTNREESSRSEQPRKKKKLHNGDPVVATENGDATTTTTTYTCSHCTRIFQSIKARDDHVRAKHSGINTYIAPDWSIAKQTETNNLDADAANEKTNNNNNDDDDDDDDGSKHEECHICGLKLIGRSVSQHFEDFVPVEGSQTFRCDFCPKSFREERAKLQHMNFCSQRSQ